MARSTGSSFKIDFRDAQPGGKRRYPESDYKVKIDKAERGKSQNGNSQIIVTYEFLEPEKFAGKTLRDYFTLTRAAAWRIGNLFDAVGIKWSQKIMEFNTSKLLGKELGITLTDDTYNGRVSSKVSDYLDLDTIEGILSGEDVEDELDEEDEEDEEDTEDEEDELENMGRAELRAFIQSKKLNVKVRKSMTDDDIRAAIAEEIDEEEEDLEKFDEDDL